MANIIVVGAGIGGVPAAYELQAKLGRSHHITVVSASEYFQFIPSNPWLAIGKRVRDEITVELRPHLEKKGIAFIVQPVESILAEENRLALADGTTLDYDYLVITTGPRLAFEEVAGAGPVNGFTHSICTLDHAERAFSAYERFFAGPRAGGRGGDAGRQLLWPGL
jgi:sulfide:quinone oxidoreductase